MRRIRTDKLCGKEILAKDVYSKSGVILIPAGTELKAEYIKKLKEFRISDVFVEDEISEGITMENTIEEEINKQCKEELKKTLEHFSYHADGELTELIQMAEHIMVDVLNKKEVMYNITNVRDHSTGLYSHSLSVAALAVLLAINAGYSEKEIKDITIGALLHDIGYISVRVPYEEVILEEAEAQVQREIKRHVVYGYSDVENQSWISTVSKDIILYHHERNDKSGYPLHLGEEKVRKEVKLVAICDAFDNMVYGNLQRRMKVYEAIEYIIAEAGVKFDLELVQIFVRSVAAYPIGSLVRTNIGDRGIVIRQNMQAPTRPVIRTLVKNENGEWEKGVEKDLTEELTLFIVDTIEE